MLLKLADRRGRQGHRGEREPCTRVQFQRGEVSTLTFRIRAPTELPWAGRDLFDAGMPYSVWAGDVTAVVPCGPGPRAWRLAGDGDVGPGRGVCQGWWFPEITAILQTEVPPVTWTVRCWGFLSS